MVTYDEYKFTWTVLWPNEKDPTRSNSVVEKRGFSDPYTVYTERWHSGVDADWHLWKLHVWKWKCHNALQCHLSSVIVKLILNYQWVCVCERMQQ